MAISAGLVYAIISTIVTLAVVLLIPAPEPAPPPGVDDDLNIPVAEEGGEIAVIFGSRLIKGYNVVWYGDLETEPVKVSSGK